MAQKVKTSERYIRISDSGHSLDISSNGRNWTNCLGTTEVSATYQDLISYKGYVLAIVKDHFYCMKILDRLGTVKFSSSLREKIIRFEYGEDNLLHGYDENETDFVLNEFDIRFSRFSWIRHDKWKEEQKRKSEKDEKERKRKEWEKEKAVKKASKSQSPKNYSKRSYSSVSSTGGKELGCLGNLFVGIGSCLGTILIIAFLIWVFMKVLS